MKFLLVCFVAVAWAQLSCAQTKTTMMMRLIPKAVTFYEAEKLCQREGGILGSIDSQGTMDNVLKYIATTPDLLDTERQRSFWIGRNDIAEEREFVNSNGARSSNFGWCKGEPNNLGNQDCTRYAPKTKCFDDDNCGEKNFFLCGFIQ